jgi:hypothetical protein
MSPFTYDGIILALAAFTLRIRDHTIIANSVRQLLREQVAGVALADRQTRRRRLAILNSAKNRNNASSPTGSVASTKHDIRKCSFCSLVVDSTTLAMSSGKSCGLYIM